MTSATPTAHHAAGAAAPRRRRAAALASLAAVCLLLPAAAPANAADAADNAAADRPATKRPAERLDRGLVAVPTDGGVLVSWRMLGSDPEGVRFDLYRSGTRIYSGPLTNTVDPGGGPGAVYELRTILDGRRQPVQTAAAWAAAHRDIPLQRPLPGVSPDGTVYTYSANDASVGDLDGDGRYEIVLKWDPSNSKDNSQAGYTGEAFLDAYELDGTRLWRIGMGRNIRAGAHYTQFLVYDFDGDGRAEVAAKTADGTTDGTGGVIGDPHADHRDARGFVLSGPEFLTVFDGATGRALSTAAYDPPRGDVCDWGDCYGNRADRFLAAVAYLDGERPSLVMVRGYYTRTVMAAYDWRDGRLTRRWRFDTDDPKHSSYAGQGNHNLSVADVDGDGRDEITTGSIAVDDDGTGLYNTGLGHGDAMHLGDFDPRTPGLEVFDVHEDRSAAYGFEFRDAATGEIRYGRRTGRDTGRGLCADVDPQYLGEECWALDGRVHGDAGGIFAADGERIGAAVPSVNAAVWWDGDLGRELLDHTWSSTTRTGVGRIDKWLPEEGRLRTLLTATGTRSNNWTKGNPVLQADLLGDWREEVIWRTADSGALRLYSTPHPTPHRLPTLMHDPVYRLGIAWQNVAYNQPPHTGFYLGVGMARPTRPAAGAGTAAGPRPPRAPGA